MSHCLLLLIASTLQSVIATCEHNAAYDDSYKICQMFRNSPMQTNINWWNISTRNYCDWVANDASISNEFNCNGANITRLDFDETPYCIQPYSTINTSFGWPQHIEVIDF
eukprot:149505_1